MKDSVEEEIFKSFGVFSNRIDEKLVVIDAVLSKIKNTMITKEYLDDKIKKWRVEFFRECGCKI